MLPFIVKCGFFALGCNKVILEFTNGKKSKMEFDKSVLETVVAPRTRDPGDHFEARRALPTTQKCMSGRLYF